MTLTDEQQKAIKSWRLSKFRVQQGRLVTILFVLASLYMAISQFAFLAVKVTNSIEGKLFVIWVGEQPQKNDLVMFKPKQHLVEKIGLAQWTKGVCGVAGDVVTHKGRTVFVNGKKIGEAIAYSKLYNKNMELIDDMVIPKGYVFVCGTHEYSFDSRYKLVGLVDEKTFIGRATRLF